MSKTDGLGDNFYVNQYNVSGDVNSLGVVSAQIATLDVTGIDKYAYERIGGQNTGQIDFTNLFNVDTGRIHAALSELSTSDVQVSYFHKPAIGNPAASIVGKQLNYDGTRGQDGDLKTNVSVVSNGYGLEWGQQLTAGVRTDTAATNGASLDTTASKSFGGQAYLHVFDFAGTDVTVKIQDSADNASFSDVSGFGFTAVTAPTKQRIALGSTATLRRYIRVVTTTSGGFTSVSFAVNLVKNEATTAF